MMDKIKIIRVLWGASVHVLNEIPKVPIFKDELVYVWGTFNNNYLLKLGYKTVLIGTDITDPNFSTHLKHFAHKLLALEIAENTFDEYLFLDWDVSIIKPLDDEFYEKIREGNNIQCPLYAYNLDYPDNCISNSKKNNTYSPNLEDFVLKHMENISKYHWKYDDCMVIPCFCFFYSRYNKIISELISIMFTNNILTCIEEFTLMVHSNCTLDDYINKYEPIVIRGKEGDKNLKSMDISIDKINKYIQKNIIKNVYLVHDIN